MLEILSDCSLEQLATKTDGCLLVYCGGYIYLCERNVTGKFRKGIDISYLAKEFGTVQCMLARIVGPIPAFVYLIMAPAKENSTFRT